MKTDIQIQCHNAIVAITQFYTPFVARVAELEETTSTYQEGLRTRVKELEGFQAKLTSCVAVQEETIRNQHLEIDKLRAQLALATGDPVRDEDIG